jgi:hypothetical protein
MLFPFTIYRSSTVIFVALIVVYIKVYTNISGCSVIKVLFVTKLRIFSTNQIVCKRHVPAYSQKHIVQLVAVSKLQVRPFSMKIEGTLF